MISVIVAFSRPQFKQNVIDNFLRQSHSCKRLVVVENGPGVGCFKDSSLPCAILSSGQHHALAKNEGMQWVRNHGGGWWACMDDDDYYGPEYLTEIDQLSDKADVLGKIDRFVRTENNGMILVNDGHHHTYNNGAFLGATLAARSEDTIELKEVLNDDAHFVREMAEKGARTYSSSFLHFMHCRYHQQAAAWALGSQQMAQIWLDTGSNVVEWDTVEYDIVNGKSDVQGFRPMELKEFRKEDFPGGESSLATMMRAHGFEPDPNVLR